VSIAAQCPHCETRFNLQPEMNGKSMRCPNLECRQVFTVQAMEAAEPAPPPPPEPPPKVAATKPGGARPPKPKPRPVEAEVVDAVVVEAAVVSPPKVKEVVWSEGTDVPPPKKGRKPPKAEADEPDPDYIPRRKKKKSRGPLILAGMGVVIVAVLIFVTFWIVSNQAKKEEKLAEAAKGHYDKGEYNDAVKGYEQLAKEYPDSKKIDEYKFFHDLASMQTAVRSVTNSDDYDAAAGRLREFIDSHKDSPFAKPKSGYGHDIREAGKKLGEDIAAFAGKRVAAYRDGGSKSPGELARADKAVADGRELLPVLDPFRGPDDPPLAGLQEKFDTVEKQVKHQRARTAALDRARGQLADPTDALIQSVSADLRAAGFLDDPEARALVAAAKGKLLGLVRYEDDPADPQPVPPTAAASLLFVTPVGKPAPREPAPGGPPPGVFLCVARGILYALEGDTGALLWAARVGPDVTDPPAVARVELASGPTEVAVVTSNVGNAPAVSWHLLRPGPGQKPGEPIWYQPLPAPAAGPAVVVGGRAFVPVRDAPGTVYEFDLTTGRRVGRIRIGQAVADRGAALRPGTGLLYVAADARRLYVIDAGGKDEFGNRVNPRCLQAIATGHLPGTLRVPPLFVGPQGAEPAERWMVLAQADGTAQTLLRAFPLEAAPAPPAEGAAVPETPAAPAVSLPVPGWVTFAPVSDGERLAVITDTGHFRLFGVKQVGNSDRALFPMPAPESEPAPGRPVPGLVIPTEESTYWMLAAGKLRKVRLALVASKGQEVVPAGPAIPLGEPVHRAQLSARRDTACAVVRSLNSSGCRAVAFDLRSGEIRWQQQLGIVPAKASADRPAAPVAQGDRFVLVDEDGGIVAVPVASNVGVGQSLAAPAAWALAPPPAGATGPTVVAASPDGKALFAVTPVERGGAKFVVRRVADGKLAHEDQVTAPAALAGQPAVVGGELLIPTADGFVNRLAPGDGRARPGSNVAAPPWQGEPRAAGAACAITPLSDSAFATSDGGKKLSRWDWPAGGKWGQAGAWDLHQAAAGPGVVLPAEPGGPPRLVVADAGGVVRLFAADRTGPPLRYWRPGGTVPAGRPGSALVAQPADPTRTVVAYVVDGKAVAAISPEREDALWAVKTGDGANAVIVGAPQPAGANRWVVTDLAGRVLLLDGDGGEVVAALAVGLPGAVPAAASGVAAGRALTPLSDGSAAVIELPKAK
jgi:outer membrane protein assembly factor BamB